MPMIAGDTTAVDGTLSGELYLALDGIDADVAADTFRRALCEAFGIAIATHANETIVEDTGPPTSFYQTYAFSFFNATTDTLYPAWQQTNAQTSPDVVSARLTCPYAGRVVAVQIRAANSPGSIAARIFRATGSGSASALTGTTTLSSVSAGVMRLGNAQSGWTFSQNDWIALELNPSGTWGNADGCLVVEYTL
jgi:hypothetical protein